MSAVRACVVALLLLICGTAIAEEGKVPLAGPEVPPIDEAVADAQDACDPGKNYCKDMRACSEAYYYFTTCGQTDFDRDNDGIPCESLCGKTIAEMKARIGAKAFVAKPTEQSTDKTKKAALGFADVDVSGFECGAKKTCRQMETCEEATFYLENCGVKSLDGNRDGIACNGLCRR